MAQLHFPPLHCKAGIPVEEVGMGILPALLQVKMLLSVTADSMMSLLSNAVGKDKAPRLPVVQSVGRATGKSSAQ